LALRESSRSERGLRSDDFVLLLVGNDWGTKGIYTIFEAMARLAPAPVRLLIVGEDTREPYCAWASKLGVLDRCIWQATSANIIDSYAAADVYVCPSREDSFGLPVLEAMACGLPVVTSAAAGVSELVENGADGFVLQDPRDSRSLAQLLARLYEDSSFRCTIGEAAALTAREWTWQRSAAAAWQLLKEAAARKSACLQRAKR